MSQNASDVHFSVGQQPICRINGELVRLERLGTLSDADVKGFIEHSAPAEKLPEMETKKTA